MALKTVTEIPTIDVVRVAIQAAGATDEYALNTASKIAVEPVIETTDAVKLIIKGILKAQKKEMNTLTGNKITLTDNVFLPEIVKILQGGTITLGSTAVGTGDSGLLITSKDISKVITITLVDPDAANQSLLVTVTGNDIVISLATGEGPGNAITSTATLVAGAIAALPAAAALISVAQAGAGSGVMVAAAETRISSPVTGYTPPVVGSDPAAVPAFTLKAYTAQYNAAGEIVQYECINYPNCSATPIAFSSEDGVFRVPEYTINSNPANGVAPYAITYIDSLPAIA